MSMDLIIGAGSEPKDQAPNPQVPKVRDPVGKSAGEVAMRSENRTPQEALYGKSIGTPMTFAEIAILQGKRWIDEFMQITDEGFEVLKSLLPEPWPTEIGEDND